MKKSLITSSFLMLISLCLYAVTTETYNIQNSFSYTSTQTYTTSLTISPNMTFVKGGSTNLTAIYASQARSTAVGTAYSFSGIRRFLKLLGTTSNAYVSVNVTGPCKIYAYIISVSGTNNFTISDGTTALASKSVTLTGNTFDQLSADYTTCSAGTIQLYSTNSSNGIYLGAVVIEYPDVSPCKLEPTITTLPTLGSVNCGQLLSNVSIVGGVAEYNGNTVGGTFSFKTPSTKLKLSDSGVTSFPLVFTPTDTETYNTKEVNVTVTVSDNGNCDPCDTPDGYYMIDCFETANIGDAFNVYKAENTGSATTATVAIDPVVSTNQAILFSNKNYGHYLKLNVSLPCGRTLNDYESVSFDVYCPTGIGSYQPLNLGINQNLFSTDNNGTNTLTTWTTLVRAFPAGFSTYSSLSSFTLELGFRTSTKDYYIDKVMLKEKAGLAACTSFATDYFRSNSTGNWSDINTWQSSSNNSTWISATLVPTSTAASVSIRNGHTVTITENASVSDLTVVSGATLNINAGRQFTVNGNLSNSGTLELLSDANETATMLTNGTVIGTYKVNQYLAAGRNWYFSSPISNATSAVFKVTEGNQLWERNVPGNSWTEITATDVDLTPLKGYIGKVAANGVVTFNGTLNNANIPALTLTKSNATNGKFHLVGNPYPSYLDWQAVAVANPNLTGSMWFRTKTAVSEQVPTSVYTFSTVLYTTEAGLQIVNGNANTTVTPKIPPMQAFWVRINDGVESVNFTVNNDMRYHADATGNKFKAPAVKNQTLRLEVSNGVHRDEALLYFNDNASDNFDRFDSPKMFNNIATVPEIYTQSGLEKLVINGMNSYNYTTEIPLGFNAGQTNSYSIRATDVQNFDADTRVVLFDTDTETEFDLTAGEAYNFSSDAVNSDIRFSIRFKSASGVNSLNDNRSTGMCVYSQQKQLIIQLNTGLSDNAKVTVYNTMGQSIYNQPLHNAVTQLSQIFEPGAYVIKVGNGDKLLVVKSLIY